MKQWTPLLIGIAVGALAWALAYPVSGRFEPFDSGSGFLVSQLVLGIPALALGYKRGIIAALVLVAGGYLGMNAYAYVAGGSEQRVWAMLLLFTSSILVAMPALAGLAGGVARHVRARQARSAAAPKD